MMETGRRGKEGIRSCDREVGEEKKRWQGGGRKSGREGEGEMGDRERKWELEGIRYSS